MDNFKIEEFTNEITYKAVESREEVLRQLQEGLTEIIDLDPDPSSADDLVDEIHHGIPDQSNPQVWANSDQHYVSQTELASKRHRLEEADDGQDSTGPNKKRKLTGDDEPFVDFAQTVTCPPSSIINVSSPVQSLAQNPKKSLWHTDNVEQHMARLSGLPSPESLRSDTSLDSTSQEQLNQDLPRSYLQSTWSFENIEELLPVSESNDLSSELVTRVVPGLNGLRQSPSGRSYRDAPDVLQKKKDEMAEQDIEKSRQLRERTQRRKAARDMDAAKHINREPTSDSVPQKSDRSTSIRIERPSAQSSLESNEDPDEIERLLDIAEDHGRSQLVSNAGFHRRQKPPQPAVHRMNQPNSFSREAAERWRTQDRHLVHTEQSKNPPWIPPASREPQSSRVTEEERIAQVLHNARWKNLARQDKEAEQRLLNAKFHGPDLQGDKRATTVVKPKARLRTVAEVQNDLHKLMGTTNTSTMNQNSSGGDTAGLSISRPDTVSRPSLSKLNQLSSYADKIESASKTPKAIPQEVFDKLPGEAELEHEDTARVQRPVLFDKFSKEQQELFVERDLKREREKDLEIIRSVYTLAAQLGSIVPFDTSDVRTNRQLSDIRGFTEAILKHKKFGSSLRGKIRAIRDFFKKRLDATGLVPDKDAANDYLSSLLQPQLYEQLASETAAITCRLAYLTTECNRVNTSYHYRNPRAAALSASKNSTSRSARSKSISSTRPLSAKQKLAQLRSTLNLFDKGSEESGDETEVIDLGPSKADREEGEISEEDEGEMFMRPAGLETRSSTVPLPKSKINTGDNNLQNYEEQAAEQPAMKSQTLQGTSQGLLNNMLARRQQQSHLNSQGIQRSDPQIAQDTRQRKVRRAGSAEKPAQVLSQPSVDDDIENGADFNIEEESGQEFEDSDLDEESENASPDDDDDDRAECKRYIVKGVCQGLAARLDSSDYILGHYLHMKKAKTKALSFAAWVREQLPNSGQDVDIDDFRESISESKTSFEQKVIFGEGEKVSCRAWVEQELYQPSEEAYEKAKIRKACQGHELWFVDWERTIKPYEEPDENASETEEADDEDLESESTSNIEDPSPVVIQSTDADEANNAKDLNEAQPDGKHKHIDRNSAKLSSAQSAPTSSIASQPDSSMSTTENLVAETGDNTKDIIMSNDEANSEPDSPIFEAQHEDEDDLFGPEPTDSTSIPTNPPTSSPTEPSIASRSTPPHSPSTPSVKPTPSNPLITRATGDHIRLFTTVAHANRHAKDVFMRWYIDHLPGLANQGFIELEDEAMEEELRAIGNQSCWSRTEDFIKVQHGEGDEHGEKVKVIDQLRVWVRKGKCFGPSN